MAANSFDDMSYKLFNTQSRPENTATVTAIMNALFLVGYEL